MSFQRHIIKRQVIEVHGRDADCVRLAGGRIGRLFHTRLRVLVERWLNELSESDVIHRLDRVELNLGNLPVSDLEAAFETRFGEELRRSLSHEGMRRQPGTGRNLRADSARELLSYFLNTGTLPWWADSNRANAAGRVDGAWCVLRSEDLPGLRAILSDAVRSSTSLRRMINASGDSVIASVAAALDSGLNRDLLNLYQFLSKALESQAGSAPHRRAEIWNSILREAGRSGWRVKDPHLFVRNVLSSLALRFHLGEREMRERLESMAARAPGMSSGWADVFTVKASRAPSAATFGIEPMLQRLAVADRALIPWIDSLHAHLHRLSASEIREFETLLRDLLNSGERAPGVGNGEGRGGTRRASEESSRERLMEFLNRKLPWGSPSGVPAATSEQAEVPPADLRFSDIDEVFVGNAGLVLLWPFLESFFHRLDLLEGRTFKNEPARHRAVALLDFLASGEVNPAEFLLPLNKVLCGLPVEEVFEPGDPLAEAEIEECGHLLSAVISRAPVLRNMSATGFRGSFLLRSGQLSARDGAWLLRVERETHDVVLERFPWSISWLKLPWMSDPMQVEW